jgi:AbrB family looped-hinge helix DNA binding protein
MKTSHSKLEANGRVVLPAEYRRALGLKPGDPIVVSLEGDAIRLHALKRELAETQRYFRQFGDPDELWSESLIRDRRTEAEDE